MSIETLRNLAGENWVEPTGPVIDVTDPATGSVIAHQPASTRAEVDAVIEAAAAAFWKWRMTPVPTRAAIMFRYRELVNAAVDELADIIVRENGKTVAEAKGELLRGLQYIEHACAIPELMKGSVS